ncbi:MAG: hypothetical protein J7M38_12430, partial [Armatimonadetes bacterium]|nr:hypothetical protein [Armatimonadota bacterium]
GEEVAQGSDPTDPDDYRDAEQVAWEQGLEAESELDAAGVEIDGWSDAGGDMGLDDAGLDADDVGVDDSGFDAGGFDDGDSFDAGSFDDGGYDDGGSDC